MLEFIAAGENLPFGIAIALMVLIALFEGVGALLGLAIFSTIDSLLPDFDTDIDLDTGDVEASGALSRVLGWLRVGRVPVLVLLIMFLTAFGLTGYLLQGLMLNMFGLMLPALVAAIAAFIVGLQAMHLSAALWSRAIPNAESSGVSSDDFVGSTATVTIGVATRDKAAEAKLSDRFGQAHFVMVRPDTGQDTMPAGTTVLLVRRNGSEFVAIHPDRSLIPDA
ncbi:YqiJ family protein [Parahaliea mediterranea]|uniref:YqiJ family protein n=1 Tax=Parahaliea mediterranea TaxID=651086 RepID=A0A939DHJ2_9GAMM|nr:YqiJ family protein [Parahaliea mediterranea]MBN7797632.1 YqiJ family protein [Parahaliea mediterranea]